MKKDHSAAEQRILLFSIFVVSLCGIIYELVLGSLATYLLGNPVVQYSITIGFFLSSMGLGSYFSRFVRENLVRTFIIIEIILGLVGGLSVIILNYLFSFTGGYYFLHIFFLSVIGILVGMEIPLLTRILKVYGPLKDVISNVLTIDYLGGLAGSLLFPLLMFPLLGRYSACAVTGIANIAVAVLVMSTVRYEKKKKADFIAPVIAMSVLVIVLLMSGMISRFMQSRLYADDIVFSKRSKYQEIVLTRDNDDFRLYLDGSIQFSTSDEYRYHEMLIHPALSLLKNDNISVLIMGGGDGMAVREALKDPRVSSVTLVELDALMIELSMKNSSFLRINKKSLLDPRVAVVNGDAYDFVRSRREKFNLVIADFSDPHDETISKLYTEEFYRMIAGVLQPDGIFVTQSTSPLSAGDAFWCIRNTAAVVFPHVVPYHVLVPSFGDWGFVMASKKSIQPEEFNLYSQGTVFCTKNTFTNALFFPADSSYRKTKINTFDRPVLYTYYIKGWKYAE